MSRLRQSSTALALLFAIVATGCAPREGGPVGASSRHDDGLFRDFLHGSNDRADGIGHPLNATVTPGCADRDCTVSLAGSQQAGSMTLSIWLRPSSVGDATVPLARFTVLDGTTTVATAQLTGALVRQPGEWMSFPIGYQSDGGDLLTLHVERLAGTLDIDYVELMPQTVGLVLAPGSGEFADADEITVETAPDAGDVTLTGSGQDLTGRVASLVASGAATDERSSLHRVLHLPVGALLEELERPVDLVAQVDGFTARMQVRATPPDCAFVGDATGKKVLLTGFQPFPADATHDNISRVAVGAARPEQIAGAQIMRLELPVEYDRAAAEVVAAISRCQPDVVISFGQGGDDLNLEQTAYNLQDTSEVAGGVPDNRGIVVSDRPIVDGGDATRATRLPIDGIAAALTSIGVASQHSTDPGRYVCNNVFFAELGSSVPVAGFVHLPYTTDFPDDVRAHWGQVVETIVAAALR